MYIKKLNNSPTLGDALTKHLELHIKLQNMRLQNNLSKNTKTCHIGISASFSVCGTGTEPDFS